MRAAFVWARSRLSEQPHHPRRNPVDDSPDHDLDADTAAATAAGMTATMAWTPAGALIGTGVLAGAVVAPTAIAAAQALATAACVAPLTWTDGIVSSTSQSVQKSCPAAAVSVEMVKAVADVTPTEFSASAPTWQAPRASSGSMRIDRMLVILNCG